MDPEEQLFYWKDISVSQCDDVFKIGTDALLLGSWISRLFITPHKVLDIGCGSGILSMMAAHAFPEATIEAIDIKPEAIALANKNFANSLWANRLTVQESDLFSMQGNYKSHYDLLICNPPFYYAQLEAKSELKKNAKHSLHTALHWIKTMESLLSADGNLCIVVPFETVHVWITASNAKGLYNQRRLDVYSFHDDPFPKRTLMQFHRQLEKPRIDKLVIYQPDLRYTTEYLSFTSLLEGSLIANTFNAKNQVDQKA